MVIIIKRPGQKFEVRNVKYEDYLTQVRYLGLTDDYRIGETDIVIRYNGDLTTGGELNLKLKDGALFCGTVYVMRKTKSGTKYHGFTRETDMDAISLISGLTAYDTRWD